MVLLLIVVDGNNPGLAGSIERILTSGQQSTAREGACLLAELVTHAEGRIIIMPGGGISAANVSDLVRSTGVTEVHWSGMKLKPSSMKFRNEESHMGSSTAGSEYMVPVGDACK
eukprot:gene3842-4227_t